MSWLLFYRQWRGHWGILRRVIFRNITWPQRAGQEQRRLSQRHPPLCPFPHALELPLFRGLSVHRAFPRLCSLFPVSSVRISVIVPFSMDDTSAVIYFLSYSGICLFIGYFLFWTKNSREQGRCLICLMFPTEFCRCRSKEPVVRIHSLKTCFWSAMWWLLCWVLGGQRWKTFVLKKPIV